MTTMRMSLRISTMMMTTMKMVLGGAAGLMMYVENFSSCIRIFLSKKLHFFWGRVYCMQLSHLMLYSWRCVESLFWASSMMSWMSLGWSATSISFRTDSSFISLTGSARRDIVLVLVDHWNVTLSSLLAEVHSSLSFIFTESFVALWIISFLVMWQRLNPFEFCFLFPSVSGFLLQKGVCSLLLSCSLSLSSHPAWIPSDISYRYCFLFWYVLFDWITHWLFPPLSFHCTFFRRSLHPRKNYLIYQDSDSETDLPPNPRRVGRGPPKGRGGAPATAGNVNPEECKTQ